MYVTVADSTLPVRELVLADLTFDVFDPDADVLRGTAPMGAVVEVGVGNEDTGTGGQTVADVDGNWFVDLMTEEFGFFDLTGDMGGQAWISDGDGDQTVAEPIPPPAFQASLTNDWLNGWSFAPDDQVLVEIVDVLGDSVFNELVPTDGMGNFNVDNPGVDLVPGMEITVDAKSLTLVDLTFDTFDVVGDVIGGTAAVGANVQFGVGNETEGFDGVTVADGDGNWSVDLSTQIDLTGDMGGQAWISDGDGDQTVAEPRIAQFQASLTNDWVQGWNFTPESSVLVEIFDSFGGTVQFTASPSTDGQGNFNVGDLSGLDLVPGMYVTVADSTLPVRELVLADLTFDVFDIVGDAIGGTAAVGANVQFGVGNETEGFGGTTVADGDGNWSVDLSTQIDLTGDMGGEAWISDGDGDQTVAEPQPLET
jgi:hypothetical protein